MTPAGEQKKAIGAAITGGLVGTGTAFGALPPDTPWYGQMVLILISMLLPYLAAFWLPNTPSNPG